MTDPAAAWRQAVREGAPDPDDYPLYDDDPCDDLPDDDDDWDLMNCGMMPDGQCTQAGTEFCDWECPIGRQPRRRAMLSAPPATIPAPRPAVAEVGASVEGVDHG